MQVFRNKGMKVDGYVTFLIDRMAREQNPVPVKNGKKPVRESGF
jgi:hypothetical protein